MSALVSNSQWLETAKAEFAARTGAALTFWSEFRKSILELTGKEPARHLIAIHASDDEPNLISLSVGLFDLKLACDSLSNIVFYAFSSESLKNLTARKSAIFFHGQLNLVRGAWGVVDNPGIGVPRIFADDPQTVEKFPLADRFAQWCIEQLLGGYNKIAALEEAQIAAARARTESARKGAGDADHNSAE
ncbi:MAG TPA: hypothetical protein VHT28_07835 [Silvibacterium sp.]|nr:hypothetical protein [Silvibacterium sp.]